MTMIHYEDMMFKRNHHLTKYSVEGKKKDSNDKQVGRRLGGRGSAGD